jgi:hypothetical protein
MLSSLDITSKADVSVVFIEDGLFKFKSLYSEGRKEHKFVYVLSRVSRQKVVSRLQKEELDKLLVQEDKDVSLEGLEGD